MQIIIFILEICLNELFTKFDWTNLTELKRFCFSRNNFYFEHFIIKEIAITLIQI